MAISARIREQLVKASFIRRMFEEGEQLKRIHGPERVFDFTLGNPSVEPPPAFSRRLLELASRQVPGMHRYMSNAGYTESRRAVAEVLRARSGMGFTDNHVLMTCGASGALNVILKTILNPGDEVIILAPYFVEYVFYIDNHGGVPRVVPTREEDFQIDVGAVAAAIGPRTRAVIINSPNNPTGVVYRAGVLRELGDLLRSRQKELGSPIYLISDEPYARIVYDGVVPPCIFDFYENTIVANSFSKDLSLAGERIGYLAVSPRVTGLELLMEGLTFSNRVLGFVNAPALMQRVVAGLLDEAVDLSQYRENRDTLYNSLTEMGYRMIRPQGAFYLFPRSPIPDDVEFVRAAQRHNLLLVPGSGFGTPGYFRLAYCVPREVVTRSLPAFAALAAEFGLPHG